MKSPTLRLLILVWFLWPLQEPAALAEQKVQSQKVENTDEVTPLEKKNQEMYKERRKLVGTVPEANSDPGMFLAMVEYMLGSGSVADVEAINLVMANANSMC